MKIRPYHNTNRIAASQEEIPWVKEQANKKSREASWSAALPEKIGCGIVFLVVGIFIASALSLAGLLGWQLYKNKFAGIQKPPLPVFDQSMEGELSEQAYDTAVVRSKRIEHDDELKENQNQQ